MTDDSKRVIDMSVEVTGTPEQVWEAIASGPGISSWYVPTTMEQRAGGALTQRFGPGEGMTVEGRVAAWEPPRRVLFDGGEGVAGLAFEWLVEARDGGTCVVRLVNSGFGDGAEWDGQYDGMVEGWTLFLHNLQLHLTHFPGQAGTAMLPMGAWPGPREAAWGAVLSALGLPAVPRIGETVSAGGGCPPLAGTVLDCVPGSRLSLLLTDPAPGTAFVAVEGLGDQMGVSVWSYLYGPDAPAIGQRDEPRWLAWMDQHGSPVEAPTS